MLKDKYGLWLSLILILLGCFGCARGQNIKYHDIGVNLHNEGSHTIAVTVLDKRKYVVDGEKNPSFIGIFRGAYGDPYDVFTESNKPLAEDITTVVCSSLNNNGYNAIPVSLENSATMDQVFKKLRGTSAELQILLTISDWYSHTYINTIIFYDVKLRIMDNDLNIIGFSAIKGEDDLGGNALDPYAHAKKEVPKVYENTLEILFNNNSIVSALSTKQTLVPSEPIERPGYTFQPPFARGWAYYSKKDREDFFSISYGGKPSPTHTFAGSVAEIESRENCLNPKAFIDGVKKAKEVDLGRFKILKDEINLDPKYGQCSVKFYQILEDHGATDKGDNEYLVLKLYGYFFIHTDFNNKHIDISYSERGGLEEMDPDFEKKANMFIERLKLKEKE